MRFTRSRTVIMMVWRLGVATPWRIGHPTRNRPGISWMAIKSIVKDFVEAMVKDSIKGNSAWRQRPNCVWNKMGMRMVLTSDVRTHWLIAPPIPEIQGLSETAMESIGKAFNAVMRKGIVKGCDALSALSDDEIAWDVRIPEWRRVNAPPTPCPTRLGSPSI